MSASAMCRLVYSLLLFCLCTVLPASAIRRQQLPRAPFRPHIGLKLNAYSEGAHVQLNTPAQDDRGLLARCTEEWRDSWLDHFSWVR
jgi:hypothetical protein